MKKKSPELTSSPEPQGGHFGSPERQAGLARLAVHTTFEQDMAKVDAGQITCEHAFNHMRTVRPHILKLFHVAEAE